jgi:hypothetical protein
MLNALRRSNSTFGIALLFTTSCWAAPAFAETAKAGAGVTFEVPAGLTPQTGRPAPIAQSWTNATGTLSLELIKSPHPDGGPAAAAKEFRDWPGVGRSMVAGFGAASVRAMEKCHNMVHDIS